MKRIGITMGDPLGIGPEIILKALPKFRGALSFKVFGDPDLLSGIPADELIGVAAGPSRRPHSPEEAGQASIECLDRAMQAWSAGEIDALVTAPISKTHVQAAGFPFPGHTEYLADRTQSDKFVMMMAGPRIKVALVTIHEPIARVSSLLTSEKILTTLEITYEALRSRFRIAKPRVAVCGLNPHAGENGLLGREEIEIIAPAIAEAERMGFPCSGPKVPDAVFHEAYRGEWDAVICMYHDQGLIPFKMIHFDDGVNLTLGLPLLRTSPDHGTAFDIAGKGMANSASMEAAIRLAAQLSEGDKR